MFDNSAVFPHINIIRNNINRRYNNRTLGFKEIDRKLIICFHSNKIIYVFPFLQKNYSIKKRGTVMPRRNLKVLRKPKSTDMELAAPRLMT